MLEGYCVGLILLKNRVSKPVLNDGAGYPEILQCYPSQGNKKAVSGLRRDVHSKKDHQPAYTHTHMHTHS